MASDTVKELLFEALSLTQDGIGIFDANDALIYCNDCAADMFGMSSVQAHGKSFRALIEHCYANKLGVKIVSDDLEQWLSYAYSKRRSSNFRSFEIDLCDGRWFLITEQVVRDNHLMMYCSEITEKKKLEFELKRIGEVLLELASIDSLTQIYNRRHFQHLVEVEIERCRRSSLDACLLMVDLDYFKRVNDTYGHAAGDEVLKHFAATVKQQLRLYDIFGRFGGEEFAVFLPETDFNEARSIAERIRSVVSEMKVHVQEFSISTTVSVGLSQFSKTNSSLDNLTRDADRKLYKAKSAGRNRVVCQ